MILLQNGDDILTIIDKEEPDLILSDLVLPKRSGVEVLKEIRTQYSPLDLPVIITIGNGKEALKGAFEVGANDYLLKHLEPGHIGYRLAAHIGFSHLNRAAIKKEEVSTFRNLAITYKHHINNALSHALGFLSAYKKQGKPEHLEKISENLLKVKTFMEKIASKSEEEEEGLSQEAYLSSTLYKIS